MSVKVANVLWECTFCIVAVNCEKEKIRGMKAEGLCQHISSSLCNFAFIKTFTTVTGYLDTIL